MSTAEMIIYDNDNYRNDYDTNQNDDDEYYRNLKNDNDIPSMFCSCFFSNASDEDKSCIFKIA